MEEIELLTLSRSFIVHSDTQQFQSSEQFIAAQLPESECLLHRNDVLQLTEPWDFGVASLLYQFPLQHEYTQIDGGPIEGIVPVERVADDVGERHMNLGNTVTWTCYRNLGIGVRPG